MLTTDYFLNRLEICHSLNKECLMMGHPRCLYYWKGAQGSDPLGVKCWGCSSCFCHDAWLALIGQATKTPADSSGPNTFIEK